MCTSAISADPVEMLHNVAFNQDLLCLLRLKNLQGPKQGFSWAEIYFGHFVQAPPILFGHLEIF